MPGVLLRLGRWTWGLVLGCILAACASTVTRQPLNPAIHHWQGRMGIKVISSDARSFSANFELEGDARQGTLRLSTPLGTSLASMRWTPDHALLLTTGEPQQFDSLASLAQATLGVDLPWTNLFDWLHGINSPAAGWNTDLSALEEGKLTATRTAPGMNAELKLLIDAD